MKQPILITGVERSGSTILAKTLASSGVFFGETSKMLENMLIKIQCQNYLRTLGFDPNGQYPVGLDVPVYGGWSDYIWEVLLQQNWNNSTPWAYKGYNITLMWKTWKEYYPEAKWVIVRRKPTDVINSCMKTSYMKAFKDPAVKSELNIHTPEQGWKKWISWYEYLFNCMIESGIDYQIFWPDRLKDGDFSKLVDLFNWLGIEWDNSLVYKVSKMF